MKTLTYCKMLLLLLGMMLSFTACSDDDDDNGIDSKLCRSWIDKHYTTEEGQEVLYTHQLIFSSKKHSGQEIKKKQLVNQGTTYYESRDFTWQWEDEDYECLVLSYGAGEVKYFENVWVRNHYLSGKLDGEELTLVDENYAKN